MQQRFLWQKGFKYFIGLKVDETSNPLCIMLSKVSGYRKSFNETKYMYLVIKNDDFLEKYNKLCDKVSNTTKKSYDSETVYNEKLVKNKTNVTKEKLAQFFIITVFQHKILNILVYQCWLILFLKCQVFLEKCKYIVKEKRWLDILLIT